MVPFQGTDGPRFILTHWFNIYIFMQSSPRSILLVTDCCTLWSHLASWQASHHEVFSCLYLQYHTSKEHFIAKKTFDDCRSSKHVQENRWTELLQCCMWNMSSGSVPILSHHLFAFISLWRLGGVWNREWETWVQAQVWHEAWRHTHSSVLYRSWLTCGHPRCKRVQVLILKYTPVNTLTVLYFESQN